MTAKHRILTLAHGHPDHTMGGAEVAARDLFLAYRDREDVEDAWLLARANLGAGPRGRISNLRENEFLWEQSLSDLFFMRAQNRHEVTGYFTEFLQFLRPTIVHSHHYFQLGLEHLRAIKRADPSIVTLLTLHEYLAICPNMGLMKSPHGKPCRSGRYFDHIACNPETSPEALWLRKHRFERYFDFVDLFVAPSSFLMERYVEWGIVRQRIVVIENGQPGTPVRGREELDEKRIRNRFGFFGQINEHKGLDVVLRGLASLSETQRQSIVLEVNGANLERQSRALQRIVEELAAPLMREGVLRWRGPYERAELDDRMASVDWVIVPSTWYENSPLVIQEAYARGRPVIASDIGALREKVRHGVWGHLLPPGDAQAWARHIVKVAGDSALWDKLAVQLPTPPGISEAAEACLSAAVSAGAAR